MKFKKGDKVRTEDGSAGEILFVDKDGVEAQVALERISVKIRTDSLMLFDSPSPAKNGAKVVARKRVVRGRPK